jgi:hypothetical protein
MASFLFLLVAMKWSKKWVDFVKIKFDVNENIEWHCMQLELIEIIFNQIESKFLNWIKIHWIEMQIDTRNIENMLIPSIILDYGIEKKHNLKKIDLKSFIIKFELKSILVGIYY